MDRVIFLLTICALLAQPGTAQSVTVTIAAVMPEPRSSDHVDSFERPENYQEATEFLSKCNIKASFINAPSWTRAFEMAASGYVDGLIPTNQTEDRHNVFYFPTKPYTSVAVLAFVLKSHPATHFRGLDMFDGKMLGHIKGARLSSDFDAYITARQA